VKKIISANLKLKLLAVALSVALWFFVVGQSNTEVGVIVPIGYKDAPRDLVISNTPPDEVEVRVMGPKLFINNLSAKEVIAEIDLSKATVGLNSYRLTPSDITTPMGVEVLRLKPGTVDVRMDRLERKSLKVRPRVKGRPEHGFEVADIVVLPNVVEATSVKKSLSSLDEINTAPLDVSGLDHSMSVTLNLDIPSKYEFRSISADKVDVKVVIRKVR